MLKLVCVVIALGVCHALTSHEIKQFHNSGKYGGNVSVISHTNSHIIYSNGLPDHATQRVNPNHPTAQKFHFHISTHPTKASTPGCLPMGPIGITRTGVAIYDPYTNEMQNAVEGAHREIFDSCDGHPDMHGVYHYHKIPDSCLYKGDDDEFIGVALDGFPIYGPKASDLGREVQKSDLDECNGRDVNGHYRYHVTTTFPYFLGCFRGSGFHRSTYNCDTSSASKGNYACACSRDHSGGPQPLNGGNVQGQHGGHSPDPNHTGHHTRPSGHHQPRPSGDPLHLGPDPLNHGEHRPWHPPPHWENILGKK